MQIEYTEEFGEKEAILIESRCWRDIRQSPLAKEKIAARDPWFWNRLAEIVETEGAKEFIAGSES